MQATFWSSFRCKRRLQADGSARSAADAGQIMRQHAGARIGASNVAPP